MNPHTDQSHSAAPGAPCPGGQANAVAGPLAALGPVVAAGGFTAGQLAQKRGVSERAIRKTLEQVPSLPTPARVRGVAARAWAWESLPADWQAQFTARAQELGFRTAEDFLRDGKVTTYAPPGPFQELPGRFQAEARRWREALAPALGAQHQVTPGELLAQGLAACRRVFGREISESTWRRHFDLANERDRGFGQWLGLDLYVAPEAYLHAGSGMVAEALRAAGSGPVDFTPLNDAFAQVANPSKLSVGEKDFVWQMLVESPLPRPVKLPYALKALPGLARTPRALARSFERMRRVFREQGIVRDGRPGASGRQARSLCPECLAKVKGAAVDLDKNESAAWRRLHLEGKLCPKCVGLWRFDVRTGKSRVPASVRAAVTPDVESAAIWRHGPKAARLASPYVLRDWSDTPAGHTFEIDDVTWNILFWLWDTDREGRPYIGRGECLLTVDRRTDYPIAHLTKAGAVDLEGRQVKASFNQWDVRRVLLRAHDRVGLPHRGGGLLLENGVFAGKLIDGVRPRGWEETPWREVEMGLREEGIGIGIRHALPGNPRTKIIERVIGQMQERMRCWPGFVGFNERTDRREAMQDFLGRVRRGKEHPGSEVPSLAQFRDALDAELMAFANEPQNGRRLPGVSPLEAWTNGIGGHPGIATRPLRKLGDSARWLLATHGKLVPVAPQGIKLTICGQPFVWWGDALKEWQHRRLPVRINLEEPELLTCLPPGGAAFTVKGKSLRASTATDEEKAQTGGERARWMKHGKTIFDNLPHPFTTNIVNDREHGEEVRAVGEHVREVVAEHREAKQARAREEKRIQALAGTLGAVVPKNPRNPDRVKAALEWEAEIRRHVQEEAQL